MRNRSSRGKQAAGQSRAPGRVMRTKCLLPDTVQPIEAVLRNSNEIISKHRKLRLQVPMKVSSESGLSITDWQQCACTLHMYTETKKFSNTSQIRIFITDIQN